MPPAPGSPVGRSDDAIIFDGVSKSFARGKQRRPALKGVSFRVGAGSITGLVGPDGAGKTTTMRLVAGLMRPDDGRVSVFGADTVADARRVRRIIAYMPQRFGLYEDLTVSENLDLYADLQGLPMVDRRAKFDRLMEMSGLAPFVDRLAGRLSGGMKQKLGLMCSLLSSPRLLILDEPTIGVDPASRRDLWRIVSDTVKRDGVTVLLSTAYLDETSRCDDVVVLHHGERLDAGPPGRFLDRVTGRCFLIPSGGAERREIQLRVMALPGVIDALPQAGGVRVVVSPGAPAATLTHLKTQRHATEAPARFEDAFIDLLRRDSPPDAVTAAPADENPTNPAISAGARAPVITVEKACRRFGSFVAVDDVSFTVDKGEIFGLLGANGAGKTTTFRMLCGLLPASSGALRVAGVDMRRASASARARIGYMSQQFSLYRELRVRDNLRFFAGAYGLRARRRRERIDWAVHEFELAPMLGMVSADLPLGFKQRLSLACALMHEPEVLFLDEPTSGVDLLARREFWRRIDLLARGGVTVLITTHFMEEAEQCDLVVIMREGKIVVRGAPDEIRTRVGGVAGPAASLEDAFLALVERGEASDGAPTP